MYYGSGIVHSRISSGQQSDAAAYAAAGAGRTLCLHAPGGSTFLHEMTSWPPSGKCGVVSENPRKIQIFA